MFGKADEMKKGPREASLPMVKSRSQVDAWPRGAFCWDAPSITSTIAQNAVPRSLKRAMARATARFWPHAKTLLTSLPSPQLVRNRLGDALREVELLRRLLRLSERAEQYRTWDRVHEEKHLAS